MILFAPPPIYTNVGRKNYGSFWMPAEFCMKKNYEGLYCTGCEAFVQAKDLVDGLCPNHQKAPELVKETNLFSNFLNTRRCLGAYFVQ